VKRHSSRLEIDLHPPIVPLQGYPGERRIMFWSENIEPPKRAGNLRRQQFGLRMGNYTIAIEFSR
jgi:hypothetical protein